MYSTHCLNIVLPERLKDHLADLLLAYPEMGIRFAAFPVDAHGVDVALDSSSELVNGHARRVQMQLLLNQDSTEAVLAYLRSHFPNPAVFYWLTPVISSGRLG